DSAGRAPDRGCRGEGVTELRRVRAGCRVADGHGHDSECRAGAPRARRCGAGAETPGLGTRDPGPGRGTPPQAVEPSRTTPATGRTGPPGARTRLINLGFWGRFMLRVLLLALTGAIVLAACASPAPPPPRAGSQGVGESQPRTIKTL